MRCCIGLTAAQREALLRLGVPGLLESEALRGAAWEAAADELAHISGGGGFPTDLPAQHRDYVGGSGGLPAPRFSQPGAPETAAPPQELRARLPRSVPLGAVAHPYL